MALDDNETSSSGLSDEKLIDGYRKGQDELFAVLVRRYRQELFHFLIRFTGNRAAAEDVFQDTFLQIHQSIGTFLTDKRFKPWLFTIAANKARDHLRRNRRRAAAQLSAPIQPGGDEQFLDLMQADLPLPPNEAARLETAERVRQIVDEMPDPLREVLLLAYFQQLPYKDIAEMLGIPLGTVKSRLHTAVGTFAQTWKQRMGEDR